MEVSANVFALSQRILKTFDPQVIKEEKLHKLKEQSDQL
jgi:hypothetical protein